MVTIKIKILDLFCGLGGVARGFQTYLIENGIDFEYHAVDINPRILLAHKIINPYSLTIKRDAYSFTDEELKKYDFIWASPPCETHSIAILWKKEKFFHTQTIYKNAFFQLSEEDNRKCDKLMFTCLH